jgi:hypothetical protein
MNSLDASRLDLMIGKTTPSLFEQNPGPEFGEFRSHAEVQTTTKAEILTDSRIGRIGARVELS